MPELFQCTKCKSMKHYNEFYQKWSRTKWIRESICIECRKKQSKELHIADKSKKTAYRIRTRYNISIEEYNYLISKGECAICGSKEQLRLDHCHRTNKIRGVLCHYCNIGLGHFKENIELLKAAVQYLEKERLDTVFDEVYTGLSKQIEQETCHPSHCKKKRDVGWSRDTETNQWVCGQCGKPSIFSLIKECDGCWSEFIPSLEVLKSYDPEKDELLCPNCRESIIEPISH